MIKRPISKQFNEAVLAGEKITTIRDTPWPLGVPIMLYIWSGIPYRSPQTDVAVILVTNATPLNISHDECGCIKYVGCIIPTILWKTEGFSCKEEMDLWFLQAVKKGTTAKKYLMHFKLLERVGK